MVTRRTFDRSPGSVGDARRFVAAVLTEADVRADDVIDLARLAVSELASNAVEHARTPFEVAVEVDSCVRIAVHDGSPDPPRPRTPSVHEARGRGLLLLGEVTERWGCHRNGDGKWIWCELAR